MRNLKRVLSLAMAAAMLIGMMVISAGAVSTYEDFTDKDEIQNTEAVNTMVSLGVINGKDDGSYFDPNGIVTRAEMAALIARCLNGGIDPSLGTGASTTAFSDTKGHWAEAYIAYCANLGIINGKGDGTFGPDEQVTGTAAAKMFLCALGYRSEIEGLTGAGWDLNTDSLANKAGLYDGLTTIRPSDGLTRDNTAQVIYNGVQAQEVEYRNNYGEYSGVIYPQPNGSMLTNRFRVVKVEGVVVANEIFGIDGYASTVTGKSRFVDTNTYTDSSNTVRNYNGVYNVSIDNEMIGQRVVIYVKFQNALSPNAESATVVGEPILSAKNKVVELNKRLAEAKDVTNDVRNGGLSLNTGYSEAHFTAGDSNIAYTTVVGGVPTPQGSATNGITTRPGTRQRFIDNNGDGSVDVLISETYTLSKVSTYNSKDEKLTLTGIETGIRFADIIGEEDVAKDDYVLVIKYNNTYYLSAPETVSGTVTRYVNSKDNAADKLTIDSTDYTQSSGECKATDLLKAFDVNTMRNMVNKDYTLYLDPFGNVLAYELNKDSVGNFALVIGSGAEADLMGSLSGKVKLLMADGTKATYSVDLTASAKRFSDVRSNVPSGYSNSDKEKWMADALENGLASADNTFADGAGNGLVGQIVTYYVNDNGVVTLGQAPKVDSNYAAASKTTGSDADADSLKLNKNTASYTFDGGATVAADNSTIFFLYHPGDGGTWTAVVGLNKLSGDTNKTAKYNGTTWGDVVYYTTGNGSKVAKAIFAQTSSKFASSYNYAFTYGQWFKGMDGGNEVYNYNVVLEDGTTTTLTETSFNDHPSKALFSYTLDGSKKAEMATTHEWAGGDLKDKTVTGIVITGYENGTLAWADAKDTTQRTASAPVSANVKIWNVEDAPDVEEGSVGVGTLCSAVTDNDGAIRTIFVTGAQDEMTAAAAVSFTASDGTLTTPSAPATWTGVEAGDTLTLTSCTLAAGQKAKISWNGGAAADLIISGTLENPANNVYTVPVELPATITVKLIISEDGLTSREQTYTIAVSAPAGPAGEEINEGASKAEIEDALANGNCFIEPEDGSYEVPAGGFTVPAGKTLTIKGNLTEADGKTITTTDDGAVSVTGDFTPAATSTANVTVAGNLALTAATTISGNVTAAAVTGTSALTVNGATATLAVTGNIANDLTVTSAATVTVDGTVGGTLAVATGDVTVGGVTGVTTHTGGTLTVKGSADAKITSSGTAQLVLDNTAPAARAAMTVVEVETQDTATLTVKGAVTITTLSGLGNGAAKIDDGAVLTITNAAKAADLEKLDGEKTTTASKLTIVESSDNSTNDAADADAVFWTVPGTTGESNGTAVTSAKIPAGTYTWGSAFHGTNGDTELDGCWVKDADAT